MICAFTGHRPDKLGGYGADVRDKLLRFALVLIDDMCPYPSTVKCGFALGFDIAIAQAAVLRQIPLHAYLACDNPEAIWPDAEKERFRSLIAKVEHVTIVSPGLYAPAKMQRRNEVMVDDGERVIALWDGSKGGTANTVNYAMKRGVPVVNVWPLWKDFEKRGTASNQEAAR